MSVDFFHEIVQHPGTPSSYPKILKKVLFKISRFNLLHPKIIELKM